jgi:lysophospholipase L1-like esterase
MYDASDYLDGRNMYNDDNPTDITCFTGNLEAGIELIKETYPNMRIIVMSPTYAYAVVDGQYVSSDKYTFGEMDVLSTYAIKECASSSEQGVTFVDNLYGTITEDNADKYLIDNLHLNVEGRKLVADRLIYALDYFKEN